MNKRKRREEQLAAEQRKLAKLKRRKERAERKMIRQRQLHYGISKRSKKKNLKNMKSKKGPLNEKEPKIRKKKNPVEIVTLLSSSPSRSRSRSHNKNTEKKTE